MARLLACLALSLLFACDPARPQALLQFDAVGFADGHAPRAGACARLRIVVRNIGNAAASDITSIRITVHPKGNPFHSVYDRYMLLPAMLPGSVQMRHQDAVRFPAVGDYTLQLVLDPERKLYQSQHHVELWRGNFRVAQSCEQHAVQIR